MAFQSYSEAHRDMVARTAEAVGLRLDDLDGVSYGPKSHKGPMKASADPNLDNLNSRLINVNSIEELKKIGGIPDSQFKEGNDRHLDYPDAVLTTDIMNAIERAKADDCALESFIAPPDLRKIDAAMLAYVNGDSGKVKGYEQVINALKFPGQILVTSGEDITVTPSNPLIIGENSPYVHGGLALFGTVTVEPGGQIKILIPVTFQASQLILK